jgi:hypothetical protein
MEYLEANLDWLKERVLTLQGSSAESLGER